VVSHDVDFARSAAVVHKMVAGKVVQSGPPEEVLN
jgi:ABC-type cobalamin/Fe3+-siderophores transport system ATPase subunit